MAKEQEKLSAPAEQDPPLVAAEGDVVDEEGGELNIVRSSTSS